MHSHQPSTDLFRYRYQPVSCSIKSPANLTQITDLLLPEMINWWWRCTSKRLQVLTNFSTRHLLSFKSQLLRRVKCMLRIPRLSEMIALSSTTSDRSLAFWELKKPSTQTSRFFRQLQKNNLSDYWANHNGKHTMAIVKVSSLQIWSRKPQRNCSSNAKDIRQIARQVVSWAQHDATDWKSATVTPIYKERGKRQVATNYRPISLMSVLSKCLEKLVFKRLYSHLDKFLPIHQSGFRQRDSTAYQLARLVHRLATAGDEGNTTLACFYDLSKAFDRVWHKGLLAKLHHFGVRSHALAWITDYLSDRRQCVRLRNSTSSWLPVPAGVPQGSVLGPLLFLAYTIDLPNCVRHPTQCDQFADDTALS